MTVELEMMNEENGRLRRHIKTLEAELKELEVPAWLLKSTQALCLGLAKRVYPEVTGFQVLDDLAGVISQIDNITCGMERKRDQAAQAQTPDCGCIGPRDCTGECFKKDKDALFFERAEKLVKAQAAVEPVAWMHDQGGRVDVIHDKVKLLWLRMGQPDGFYREKVPCKVEHYTIPLFASPPEQAAVEPFAWVTKIGILLPPYEPMSDDVPLYTAPPDHTKAMRLALEALTDSDVYDSEAYDAWELKKDAAIAALEGALK